MRFTIYDLRLKIVGTRNEKTNGCLMKVGILIEETNGQVKDSVLGVVSYLRQMDVPVNAFTFPPTPGVFTEQLGHYGVDTIYEITFATNSLINDPQTRAHALAEAMQFAGIWTLFGLASPTGRDLLPRLAAWFDAPLVMDCTKVDLKSKTATTSMYSGKTEAVIRAEGERLFFGMRPNHHHKVPKPAAPEVIAFQPEAIPLTGIEYHGMEIIAEQGIDLTEAQVIISGGRGLKNGENFRILFDCAGKLGAGVGASRVAVDEGWVPYTMQVGQTGVKVNPEVYIACGISGSVQHFAGMQTSGLIIAVNKDPKAPIVAKSDYYLLGDLFEIIPRLTEKLQARSASKRS